MNCYVYLYMGCNKFYLSEGLCDQSLNTSIVDKAAVSNNDLSIYQMPVLFVSLGERRRLAAIR